MDIKVNMQAGCRPLYAARNFLLSETTLFRDGAFLPDIDFLLEWFRIARRAAGE